MPEYICSEGFCNTKFTRKSNYIRHIQRLHNTTFLEKCILCRKLFKESKKLQEHLLFKHGPSEKFLLQSSAFEREVQIYRYTYDENTQNFNEGQQKILDNLVETILFEASQKTIIKVSLIYICQMSTEDHVQDVVQKVPIPFRSPSFTCNAESKTSLIRKIRNAFKIQENTMEEYCQNGSNWKFDRSIAFDIEISGVRPVVVGSIIDESQDEESTDEEGSCQLKVVNRKWLFDPKNRDKKCFLRCLYFLLKIKPKFRVWVKTLNLKGIKFPISIHHIKKFVRLNANLDLNINILYRNLNAETFPYECGIGKGSININLLMIHVMNKNELQVENHFLAIKDINKYLASRYRCKNQETYTYEKCFFCVNCLNKFSDENLLQKHEKLCHDHKGLIEKIMPTDEKLQFQNFKNLHMQDFIGFLDFECILQPNQKKCDQCSSLRCKCDKSFSEVVNNQEPFAYSFVILSSNTNQIIHQHTYTGENAASNFIDHLLECNENWIEDLLDIKMPLSLSSQETSEFEKADNCYMCKKNFDNFDLIKCRDHNHYTGQYLGAACQKCNLNRRKYKKIPIFLHNGSKYDFHFLIQALNDKEIEDIRILPYNGEHFRSISFMSFKFLDSLAFLQSSLSQLSEDLSKTNHDYPILRQTGLIKTGNIFNQKKFDLLLKKSFFPYEYCTSLKLMEETTELPDRDKFYSTLHETTITQEDHNFAKKIWKLFKCKNLIDYTKIYCKLDTILLAEIFQKFRKDMHQFSGLDPAWYVSLPGFAFDSMLKETGCELGYLPDINMVHFFESGIRGGVSFINNRYLKIEKDGEEIVYIDANVSNNILLGYILR